MHMLVVAAMYLMVGLGLIFKHRWGWAGVGLFLCAWAYIKFELVRLRLGRSIEFEGENETTDGEIHEVFLKIFRRAGFAFVAAMGLMAVAGFVGEGWLWFVPASVGLWMAIVVVFSKQLGPRDMPARWFP